MKLAVLSDIHANLAALHTIADHIDSWQPDQVVVAGDSVNRGPQPLECLHFVQVRQRSQGWHLLQGNHEEYIYTRPDLQPNFPRSGLRHEISRTIAWTHKRLGAEAPALASLPKHLRLEGPDGSPIWITHASMRGNRDGIVANSSNEELQQQIVPEASLFCAGHTHVPMVRRFGPTLVVNTGAVGLPFDRDPRASYARLTWHNGQWHANIIRLKYDQAATERACYATGMVDAIGPIGELTLREMQRGTSLLYNFVPWYEQRLVDGAISVAAAVQEYLNTTT